MAGEDWQWPDELPALERIRGSVKWSGECGIVKGINPEMRAELPRLKFGVALKREQVFIIDLRKPDAQARRERVHRRPPTKGDTVYSLHHVKIMNKGQDHVFLLLGAPSAVDDAGVRFETADHSAQAFTRFTRGIDPTRQPASGSAERGDASPEAFQGLSRLLKQARRLKRDWVFRLAQPW